MNRSPRVSGAGVSRRSRTLAVAPGCNVCAVSSGERHAPQQLDRPLVKVHARAVLQRLRVGSSSRIASTRRVIVTRPACDERLPAVDVGELDRHQGSPPCAGPARLDAPLAVHLDAADADAALARHKRQLVFDPQAAADQGPSHDRAKPLHRERAIDRQPGGAALLPVGGSSRRLWRSAVRSSSRPAPVLADTGTIGAPSRNEPSTRSRTSSAHELDRLVVQQVALGDDDDAVSDPQAAGRCRSARASAASPTRRQPRSAARSPSRRRRRASSSRIARDPARRRRPPSALRSAVCAKPSSMVMPRSFSSFSRSGSIPVRACTSALFPWSM